MLYLVPMNKWANEVFLFIYFKKESYKIQDNRISPIRVRAYYILLDLEIDNHC